MKWRERIVVHEKSGEKGIGDNWRREVRKYEKSILVHETSGEKGIGHNWRREVRR